MSKFQLSFKFCVRCSNKIWFRVLKLSSNNISTDWEEIRSWNGSQDWCAKGPILFPYRSFRGAFRTHKIQCYIWKIRNVSVNRSRYNGPFNCRWFEKQALQDTRTSSSIPSPKQCNGTFAASKFGVNETMSFQLFFFQFEYN